MEKKAIARLICNLIESRDWESWKGEGIRENTYLTKGQVAIGVQYLAKKGYIKRDPTRSSRRWWTRTRKFCLWKILLGQRKVKLDMSTGKLKYA
jgi:hypothetical protein